MAITLRAATGGNSGAATGTTITTSFPSGAVTGDICVLVTLANTASPSWSVSSGAAFTEHGTGDAGSGTSMGSTAWFRVLQTGDTAPVIGLGATAARNAWMMIALTPDTGSTISVDAWATTLVTTVAATTFTPNAATAAGTGEASVILNASIEAAAGANTIAFTAPSGWTTPSGGTSGYGGSASNKSNLASCCYQLGVSGTVTPGSETLVAGASGTTFANAYHVLITETATAVITPAPPQLAVMRTEVSAGRSSGRIIRR